MAITNQIQVRKGTATQWSTTNPILVSGEPGFDTTNNLLKIGDGTSTWSSLSSNVGVGDAGLLSIAGLTTGADTYIYTSANDVYTTGTITTFGRSLVDDADASTARTTLGLAIGTNVQAYDAGLQSIAGLATTSGSYLYTTANDVYTTGTSTVYGRSVLAAASSDSFVTTTLVAGTGINITYDSITDTATISTSGLVIGTNIQAYDAQLADVAGLTPTDNGVIIGNGTNFVVESAATLKVSLGLTIGTDVQAYDSLFASRLAGGRISVQASNLGGGIIPDADRTGNIIIRYYHFTHGYIGLYDTTNSVWVPYSISNSAGGLNVSSVRLDTPAVTADANYDLFINYIGTPNEMALSINIWASDTTRATAISLQDGVYVKTSDKSYRYVGTLRTTSSTTTEDSKKRRFVWNYNNRVPHAIYAGQYSIHSYATATWRAFNSNTTPGEGRFEFVTGLAEDAISVNLNSSFTCGNIALALDSITTPTNLILTKTSTTDYRTFSTSATFAPQIGYHYIQSLEKGISATTSFTNVNMEQGFILC